MEGQKGLEVSCVVCDTFCLELAGFSQTSGTTDGAGIQDCFLFFPLFYCLCHGEVEYSRQPTKL